MPSTVIYQNSFSNPVGSTSFGTGVTTYGNITYSSAGGQPAVYFDGSSYLGISNANLNQTLSNYSISFLFKADGAQQNYSTLLSSGYAFAVSNGSRSMNLNTAPSFYLTYNYLNSNTANSVGFSPISSVNDGQWHTVKIDLTSNTTIFNLDGKTASINAGFNYGSSPLLNLNTIRLGMPNNVLNQAIFGQQMFKGWINNLSISSSDSSAVAFVATSDSTPPVTVAKVPTYTISANTQSINLGSIAYFTVKTTNVLAGTNLQVVVSCSYPDNTNGVIGQTVAVGSDGTAVLAIPTLRHSNFVGNDVLTVSLMGSTASETLIDNAPKLIPSYSITPLQNSIVQGGTATFSIDTVNVNAQSVLTYSIAGVQTTDLLVGQLTGSVTLDWNGKATISIPTVAHQFNQGNKTLTVTISGISASETLIDLAPTPPPTYKLFSNYSVITEGATIQFTLSTTNVPTNTNVQYILSGIDKSDVEGGAQTGIVKVDANGQAILNFKTLVHPTNQGNKNLTLTIADSSSVVKLIDPSPNVIPDTFDGKLLTIPKVSVGGAYYSNVVVSIGNILSVGTGYPKSLFDSYDVVSGNLNISSVNAFGNTFNNVIVTVGTIVSINGLLFS